MTPETCLIIEGSMDNIRHAQAMVALLDEYASSQEGGGNGLSEHVKSQLPAEVAKRSHAHVLIAWMDDTPAGLILAFEGFSSFQCRPLLNLHDVIVSKAFRGLGLSKKLLLAAEELARKLGCCKLTLEVLEQNEIAKKAYRAVGYAGYELDPLMGKAMFWERKL